MPAVEGQNSAENLPPVDKLSLRSADSLKAIEEAIGPEKTFFMLDFRHMGLSNDIATPQLVDAHIIFLNDTLHQDFSDAKIPFHLSRVGGDEFMGFYPKTDPAKAVFETALKKIETHRSDTLDGFNPVQDEGLLRLAAIRSIARSFAQSCLKRGESRYVGKDTTITERWQLTRTQPATIAAMNGHPESFASTVEQYQTATTEFQQAVALALLQLKVAHHMLNKREHWETVNTRPEDKPLGLSLVGINVNTPLTPELMGQLAAQAEAELGKTKKKFSPLGADQDPYKPGFVPLDFDSNINASDEWTTQVRRTEELATLLKEIDDADLEIPAKKALKRFYQALDPSIRLDLFGKQTGPLFYDKVADWNLEDLFREEFEAEHLCAVELDIPGFGAINNQFDYQKADDLLAKAMTIFKDQVERVIDGPQPEVHAVRQGGGKVKFLFAMTSLAQRDQLVDFLQSHKTVLEAALTEPAESYYQHPEVLSGVAQRDVSTLRLSEVFRWYEEPRSLTEAFSAPKVKVTLHPAVNDLPATIADWV